MRRIINHHQKAQVALAALKGDKTIAELSSVYQVHPSKIETWRDLLQKGAPRLFAEATQNLMEMSRIEQLQRIIGQRQEEIDWLKKKLPLVHPSRESLTH
jgi:transposase-like protein